MLSLYLEEMLKMGQASFPPSVPSIHHLLQLFYSHLLVFYSTLCSESLISEVFRNCPLQEQVFLFADCMQ